VNKIIIYTLSSKEMAMFTGVYGKLECARYYMDNFKTLAENAGGFPNMMEQKEMSASLNGFFFEIVSAKDFFLQGISDYYKLGLSKQEASNITKLKQSLQNKGEPIALKIIIQIENQLSDSTTWLWQLNNYRNSATNRELFRFGHVATILTDRIAMSDKTRKKIKRNKYGNLEGQRKAIPTDIRNADVPHEQIKMYLFKDPEDPQKGNADMEVIPYCEQSLEQMREFLDSLYSDLGI
jgi:hypothetical protein